MGFCQSSILLSTAGGRKDPSVNWQDTANLIKDLAKFVIVYISFNIPADLHAIYSSV